MSEIALLRAVVDFSRALGPPHDVGELLRAARTPLGTLPGVRAVRVYVDPDGDRPELVVRAGPREPDPGAEGAWALGVDTPTRLQDGQEEVWAFPFVGGTRGAVVFALEPGAKAHLPLYDEVARSFGAAYGAARLIGLLKERSARLERGMLERQRQLARLRARIDRLTDARDGLLALLGHDLRSPLAILHGQCAILAEVGPEAAWVRHVGEVISRQAERMEEMVDALLDRYRRASTLRAEVEVGELGGLARLIGETFGPVALRRGQSLEVESSDGLLVEADLTAVRDVVSTVVEATLRATPDGGAVTVWAGPVGEDAVLEVRGGGGSADLIGLAESSAPARIVGDSGGVWRTTRDSGGGVRVTLTFPRAPESARREHIVLVGRDLERNEGMVEALGAWWDTATTPDVVAALDEMARALPSVVLVDAEGLGPGEAIDLLQDMKSDPRLGAVPVLLLASAREPRIVERAHAAGALAVLSTPVAPPLLHANVLRALRVAAASRRSPTARAADPLTGLETRTFIDQRLPALVDDARRNGQPLPVMVLDVVDVKAVNRAHGWLAGDQLLLSVAGVLREQTSRGALPARAGGDEFLVIYPGMTMDLAHRSAAEVHRLIESSHPRVGVTSVSVRIRSDVVDATELVGSASADGLLELARGGRETPDGT